MIISSLLLSVGANLITPVFEHLSGGILDPLKKRSVLSKLDALSASVFVGMEEYLLNEVQGKDAGAKIERVINIASEKTKKLATNPNALFANSLDSIKYVENEIYKNGFPQQIVEDSTTTPYMHFYSTCINLLLEMPTLLKNWELEAWSVSYDKLDFLAAQLQGLNNNVLEISQETTSISGKNAPSSRKMIYLKSALRQAKARSEVEMRGLSRAQATPLQLQSIFVAPELLQKNKNKEQDEVRLKNKEEILKYLTLSGEMRRIIGTAGSGKTTLIRWLEQWHWTSSQKIAVRCDLRVISKSKNLPNVLDLFDSCIPPEVRGTLNKNDFGDWIDEGKTLIIFDGFDEVALTKRNKIIAWIKSCQNSVSPKNTFVVTSRELTTEHMNDKEWDDETVISVLGFDKERVKEYIGKWQKNMLGPDEREQLSDDELPDNLAETFTGAATIRELTSNPLLLSTLMIVHRFEGKKLPDGRSELYKIYIDGMLGQWYEKATSKEGLTLTASQMRRFLRNIAIHMQTSDITSVPEKKAAKWINDANDTPHYGKRILEHMLERTGLLIGPGEYQFAHKSIGEFLVAEAIISEQFRTNKKRLIDRLFLLDNAADDNWRVVLFLWAGLVPSLSDLLEFVRKIVEKGQLHIALGLLNDRIDDLLLDYKDEFTQIIEQIILTPTMNGEITDMHENAYTYIGIHNLPSIVPGRYIYKSTGYLGISGVGHFNSTLLERCLSEGIFEVSKLSNEGCNSCYYFELWALWVKSNESIDELVAKKLKCMSDDNVVIAAIQYKKLSCNADLLNVENNDIFFVPFIVDRIVGFSHNRFYGGGITNTEASVQKYIDLKPMKDWSDFWFLLDYENMYGKNNPKKISSWNNQTAFFELKEIEKIRGKSSKFSLNLINMYTEERRVRINRAIKEGLWETRQDKPPKPKKYSTSKVVTLEDIFGRDVLNTTYRIIDEFEYKIEGENS